MLKDRKSWAWAAFAAYGLLMLWLLFGQRLGQNAGNLNLELFDTLWRYIWVLKYSADPAIRLHAVINLAGNVVMFVPLGFLVPCLWGKMGKFGWHFMSMTGSIVTIELLQLLSRLGTCDIDDLLLNLVGTTIGFILWKLWRFLSKTGKNKTFCQ